MHATRTYLELTASAQFAPAFGDFPDLVVERVRRPTPELYRHCYRTVGAAYHWRDRWDWTDEEIRAHLAQPEITLHVATRDGAFAGWYELRRGAAGHPGAAAHCPPGPGAPGPGRAQRVLPPP